MSKKKEIKLEELTEEEKLKYEIAEELGLLDQVMKEGWKSLSSKQTGKIGGLVTKRRREMRVVKLKGICYNQETGDYAGEVMNETIQVLGIKMNNLSAKDALKNVMSYMETEPINIVEMVTMHTIAQFQESEEAGEIFETMDMVLASDKGILQAAGVNEERQLKEVEELLFLKMLLRYFHKNSVRVLLLAEKPEDMQKLVGYMEEDYSKIQVVEMATMEEHGTTDDMLLNLLNGAEATCVISALPSPVEEKFISKNKMFVNAKLWLGLGNLLDDMKKEKMSFHKIKEFISRQLLKKKMARKGENA